MLVFFSVGLVEFPNFRAMLRLVFLEAVPSLGGERLSVPWAFLRGFFVGFRGVEWFLGRFVVGFSWV